MLILTLLTAVAPFQATVPYNDRCVDAITLAEELDFDTSTATPDGASSCSGTGRDVWYLWLPQASGVMELSAFRLASSLVPAISVHSGCPGDSTNELACDDATSGSTAGAQLTLPVTAGQAYWIRVAGAAGTSGTGYVRVRGVSGPPIPTQPPLNDTVQTAVEIGPGEHFGITGSQPSTLAACGGIGPITSGAFYTYTPLTSGPVSAGTCGTAGATSIVGIFEGATLVSCAFYESCLTEKSIAFWDAVAGTTYTIRVGNFWGPLEESFRLELTGPPSVHASCATAPSQPIGTRWIDLGRSPSSGASTCDTVPDSDWFAAVTAPGDGVLTVSTCGSHDALVQDAGPDTRLSLHRSCPADASTELVCSDASAVCGDDTGVLADARISWPVTAGETLVVRVTRDPASSRTQPIALTIAWDPSELVCAGDGSGSACPCGNSGLPRHGCENSAGSGGALLGSTGSASVALDSLTLHARGATPMGIALYFQGTSSLGAGQPFGDGLRCVGGQTVRLGLRASLAGTSSFGAADGAATSVASAGGLPASGGERFYQVWYRDALAFCSGATFNLSNGLRVVWGP